MATLYGAGLSPFVRKVRVVLAEKGVAYDHDPVIPFNVGANWQIILNSEIEFMIIPAVQIKGVVFFDMGNGYNLEAKYCTSATATSALPEVFNPCVHYPTFQNLRYSVGFGFRWFSPIGPLRFEWGNFF